jgi:hypothetical protein
MFLVYNRARLPATSYKSERIIMILKKIVGAGAIAGALGFSALGLAGLANADPTPQADPGVVHQAQTVDWHGGGHGGGGGGMRGPGGGGGGWRGGGGGNGWRGGGGNGWQGGRGWGGPGGGWGNQGGGWGNQGGGFGGPGLPCMLLGICI